MAQLVYEIVQHDGVWAYEVSGTFSETFRKHYDALLVAGTAAIEQCVASATDGIQY